MSRSRMPSNRSSGSLVIRLALVGALIGVGFLVVQRVRHPPPPATTIAELPTLTTTPVQTVAPTAVPLPTSTALPQAILYAPTAGINSPIVDVFMDGQSWDVSELGSNVGHLQGTSWFGQPGNIGLAGHVELFDGRVGIFRNLEKMSKGDPIVLSLGDLKQNYKVISVKRVKPDDLSVLKPSTVETITLITCDIGAYNLLQNAYLDRVVVIAERVQSS